MVKEGDKVVQKLVKVERPMLRSKETVIYRGYVALS